MIKRNDDSYFVEILEEYGVLQIEYVKCKKSNNELYNLYDAHRDCIIEQSKDYKKIKKALDRRKKCEKKAAKISKQD